ncbi:MAG: 2-oxoacid:acceptor oxidoreductase family protein [Gammaproteobacteria bacterium]|nr:2-oxoacid:acceptor oxidoreductase family protein [Gammaproteobacteria bacterium]
MTLTEIRIHGRGGQGNVVAANLLAMAAFETGRYGQAFPNFGAERRGAPVVAFVRIADASILRRCQIQTPAFLIIQDEALLHIPGVTDGLLPGGKILVNSSKAADEFSAPDNTELITLPASLIAKKFLGRPVPNTALLAAFLSLTNLFPIDALVTVLAHKFSGSILEHNTQLIHQAADQVPNGHWQETIHATGH